MGTEYSRIEGAKALLRWCSEAPAGTLLDASRVAEILEAEGVEESLEGRPRILEESPPWTWRERLWACPAETRLGVRELGEALGCAKGWIYARTQAKAENPIPHRKLDGALLFTAGEVRAWLREREEVLVGGQMESTEDERRGFRVLEGGRK